jgi:hypothetical protein
MMMKERQAQLSCPALGRASTILGGVKAQDVVDGRDKPGHDGARWRFSDPGSMTEAVVTGRPR